MAALNHNRLLTVREVAEILGYTVQHTRVLIRVGKLKGKKLGRDWAVMEVDVREFVERRPGGPGSTQKG